MKKFYLLTVLLIAAFRLCAQINIVVHGNVADNKGNPIENASIKLKGSLAGTITDSVGNFRLYAAKPGTVVISYNGYVSAEVHFSNNGDAGRTVLEKKDKQLDEVVVVGYGTAKKTSLTAAVSTIKGSAIAEQPVGDISSSIGGRTAGVLFTTPSGMAGNDGATIMIRGIGTTGSQQPLYIVDGIPRNYNELNPSDIESISILKDAAAVAPYGMGGANGVILVTTKRGKTGKPSLTYDTYFGLGSPVVTTKLVNSYQYATLKNAAAINDGLPQPYSAADLQAFQDGSDPDKYANTDAFGQILKKHTFTTSHSLSLSGGTDEVKYSAGLGYYYQDGDLPNLNFQRYNLSANIQAEATSSTKVEVAINGRVEDRNLPGTGFNVNNTFQTIAGFAPVNPLVFSNGLPTATYASFYDNPSYQKIIGNVLLSQISIEQKLPVKGLSVKVVAAYDFNPTDPYSGGSNMIESFSRTWSAPYTYYTVDTTKTPLVYKAVPPTTLPSFSEQYDQTQAFTYQGYLNYSGNFGKSAISGLAVLELRNTKSSYFTAGRNNYSVPIPELFAGSSNAVDISNNGTSQASKQQSLVYRITYAYDDKYLLEASGRYDGNYYFAPGHQWGFFPAFSAGWRISQEDFMKQITWVDNLKIRGSYGESGNLAGGPFQYLSAYSLYGNSAILNGIATQGLYENSQANPYITWERAKKLDIGFESSFWKGLLTFEADYFAEKRNNMLLTPANTVPVEYGIGLSEVNAGKMNNQGIEFSIGTHYAASNDLSFGLDANFTYAQNKLVQVFETSDTYDNPNRRLTGRALGTQFGYEAIGYFTAADFLPDGSLKPGIATQPWGAVHPGDIRYKDVNGNGQIDVNDQVPIGKPTTPAIVYGFTPSARYKNFQVSLLFQGAAESSIQLDDDAVWAFFNGKSAPITAVNYWTPTNQNAPNPRITSTPTVNNTQVSSWWERNTAYLRLRTGNLSYTLPKTAAKVIGMKSTKIYLSGENLATWSPLKNFDPEISNSRGAYFPNQKAITIGLNAQF